MASLWCVSVGHGHDVVIDAVARQMRSPRDLQHSGHPTATAACVACVGVIEDERLLEAATTIGHRRSDGLLALLADDLVVAVRGDGAIWDVDLPERPDRDALRCGVVVIREDVHLDRRRHGPYSSRCRTTPTRA